MKKATTIPADQAEIVGEIADAFEQHATDLAELAHMLRDEIDFAGELPQEFVARLRRLLDESQKGLQRLVDLAGIET